MLRTTILLREDVYEFLVRMFGKRNISKGINEYLVEHIFKEKKGIYSGLADGFRKLAGLI